MRRPVVYFIIKLAILKLQSGAIILLLIAWEMMKEELGQTSKKNQLKVIIAPNKLTSAHKRLIKDLKEIEQDPIPLCGVSARPLETNLFVWHANLRGPKKTVYEGGVFHLQVRFPESYPSHPPTIRALSYLQHQNVFGGYLCLDFLSLSEDKAKHSSYQWSSVYSVQSILFQLTAFLQTQNIYPQIPNIQIVNLTNSFRCHQCKHQGNLQPWPPFHENDSKLSLYQLHEDPFKVECEQLKCYHTKLHYTENSLGLGLNLSKVPKTGLIKDAIIFEDYISIKAFLKESITQTVSKDIFTYWFPLYFGKADNADKFYFFLKRALSIIMTGSTKYFKPEFVLEVIPKIFINLVFQIMDRNKYISINLIRIFTEMHSIFLFCLQRHPELKKTIKKHMDMFIESEEYRTKDRTPNLGCFLAYLLVQDSYKFADIISIYFREQLDRHVFWILKSVPELISQELSETADEVRNQLAFQCQKTSFYIICFYKLFLSHCERRKSKALLLNEYEDNLCRFKREEENELQNQIFSIFKKVKSFADYFQYVGLQSRNEEQITKMLKEAIINSERKKYHSQHEVQQWEYNMNLRKLSKSQRKQQVERNAKIDYSKQIVEYYERMPSYEKYITLQFDNQSQESEKAILYFERQNVEQDWKILCLQRWPWVKQCLTSDHTFTADGMSNLAFQFYRNQSTFAGERLQKLHEYYQSMYSKFEKPKVNLPAMTWKTLFLRLDFEDFLRNFVLNPDFPKFYEKLFVCSKNDVNTLQLPLIKAKKIKSGYFYITALLTRLTSLKYLQFACLSKKTTKLQAKLAKAISKGLHNFYEKQGKLEIISFYNVQTESNLSEFFFKRAYFNESITSFRMSCSNLFNFTNGLKYFSSSHFPQLQEISISNCSMTEQLCKILADLLLKLKKLRIFRMNKETNLQNGITAIVANLAFNSALRLLDLAETAIFIQGTDRSDNIENEIAINLGKMVKINSNFEFLILSDMPDLHSGLTLQFWKDLGESISLIQLDVSNHIPNGNLSKEMANLGKAIAFNAKKKGALSCINLSGSIANFQSINQLYEGMNISEYHEEQWYGSRNKLQQMIPQNYARVYYNNLKVLDFNNCTNLDAAFSLHDYRQYINPEQPAFVKLLADSPKLQTLNLKKVQATKNMAQLLFLSLDRKRLGQKCQIKVLNLSQNQLGSEGASVLADALSEGTVLEVLDLSKTNMGVQGIHKISLALKGKASLKYLNLFNNNLGFDGAKSIADNIIGHSSNLQFLEMGHNRIREKGLSQLVNAILSNPQTKLKVLGVRFNFLTSLAIISNFQKLSERSSKLQQLYLRNNLIDDFGLCELKQLSYSSKSVIAIDILQKSAYLDTQKADRTAWIHPIGKMTVQQLKDFFQTTHKCGMIIDIRIRRGRKYANKKGENKFCFIQFADEESLKLALTLAAQKKTIIDKITFRVYRSGMGTFLYRKKSAKILKRQEARKLLPKLQMPLPNVKKQQVKAKKPKINQAMKQQQKCEQRYLDQIKPKKSWSKQIIWTILIIICLINMFIFWQNLKSFIFPQDEALNLQSNL